MKTNEEYNYNQIVEEARRIMDRAEPLKSEWVIIGFEKKAGNLREQAKFIDPSLITKDGERLASSLNSNNPNPTTKE
ncbi:hypothetical protein C2R81_07950 [Helicobacter pylori]|uniref:hypothetical protein n=1 Tax=Helicobacter pylori TaxID=210 RepID=UPI000D3DA71C|nr:hypothetical protein [Helicobacter pylori]PUD38379.1 hypothetical protein C2R81_07950 [Helicobacter pylori]